MRAGAVGAALGGGLGGMEGTRPGLEPTIVGDSDALHGLVHLLGMLTLLGLLTTHLVELGTDRLLELALEGGRGSIGSRGSHSRSRCNGTIHGTSLRHCAGRRSLLDALLLLLLLLLLMLMLLSSHEEGEVGIGVGSLESLDGGIDDGLARRGAGTAN